VSFRAAGILSVVMIGGMFLLPAVVERVLLPSLSDPVPIYEQILLNMAVFCARWHFVAVLPTLVVSFTLAAFTKSARTHN